MAGAGDLRDKVTLQTVGETTDTMGGPTTGATDLATVRANVMQGSTRDFLTSERLANERRITVKIRKRSDLTRNMQLVWEGITYKVIEFADIPGNTRRNYQILKAEELV